MAAAASAARQARGAAEPDVAQGEIQLEGQVQLVRPKVLTSTRWRIAGPLMALAPNAHTRQSENDIADRAAQRRMEKSRAAAEAAAVAAGQAPRPQAPAAAAAAAVQSALPSAAAAAAAAAGEQGPRPAEALASLMAQQQAMLRQMQAVSGSVMGMRCLAQLPGTTLPAAGKSVTQGLVYAAFWHNYCFLLYMVTFVSG